MVWFLKSGFQRGSNAPKILIVFRYPTTIFWWAFGCYSLFVRNTCILFFSNFFIRTFSFSNFLFSNFCPGTIVVEHSMEMYLRCDLNPAPISQHHLSRHKIDIIVFFPPFIACVTNCSPRMTIPPYEILSPTICQQHKITKRPYVTYTIQSMYRKSSVFKKITIFHVWAQHYSQ